MMTLDDYHKITRLDKVNGEWRVKEVDMKIDWSIERTIGNNGVMTLTKVPKKVAWDWFLEPSGFASGDFIHIDTRPQKTTLTIHYDNGLPFTAKNTINYNKSDTEFRYTIEREDRGVKSSTDYVVPLHDVMAIVYKQGDKVWVDKLKPCASVKIDVVKV